MTDSIVGDGDARLDSGPGTGTPSLRLPGVALGAVVTVGLFGLLAWGLGRGVSPSGDAYAAWVAGVATDPVGRVQWFLADLTEPQFTSSWIASVGLLVGGLVAWLLQRRGARGGGTPMSYGSGSWPWILGAGLLSVALSNVAFGWMLVDGWQPTFVPLVCVAGAFVLVFGRGWRVLLTGAVLGAFTTPLAMLLIVVVSDPLGLPAVVANTLAMCIGGVIAFLIARFLPWLRPATATGTEAETAETTERPTMNTRRGGVLSDAIWTVRRVLCDFSEAPFWATEWASIGMLAGVSVAVLVSPAFPAYGSMLVPQILLAQAIASAVGVTVWRRGFRDGGWMPTYIAVVSVAPATVLAYGGTPLAILLGAVAGALLGPAIAVPVSKRLPADFHPFIGNTISMALSTAVIVPLVGLVPGVAA